MRIAHIAGLSEDSEFGTRQFPADAGQSFPIASCQDQVAAFGCQSACDGQANAARSAGDECRLSLQASGIWRARQASYFSATGKFGVRPRTSRVSRTRPRLVQGDRLAGGEYAALFCSESRSVI